MQIGTALLVIGLWLLISGMVVEEIEARAPRKQKKREKDDGD